MTLRIGNTAPDFAAETTRAELFALFDDVTTVFEVAEPLGKRN